MGRRLSALWVLVLVGAVLFPAAVTAGAPPADKIDICHFNADMDPDAPTWELLSIKNGKNVDKHEAHGDQFPGDDVPDMPGYVFDDDCVPVLVDSDLDGVPDVDDNCPNTPNPDQSDRYGSAKGDACEDDSNGDGTRDVNEPHICVSIDGVEIIQNGFTLCTSSAPATPGGASNIAVAHGENLAFASASNGSNNTAIADGASALAFAQDGDNNTATATGNGAFAQAGPGNNNTAIADGSGALAEAQDPNGCTAEAIGNNAVDVCPDADDDNVLDQLDNCPNTPNPDQSDRYGSAKGDACEDDSNGDGTLDVDEPHICVSIDGNVIATRGGAGCITTAPATPGGASNIAVAHGLDAQAEALDGNNNTATADGEFASALAVSGDNNTATATGEAAVASARRGDNNTSNASGELADAVAEDGNNNTATATGDFADAFATDGNNNTATAIGFNASARAEAPGGCIATAIGDNAVDTCP